MPKRKPKDPTNIFRLLRIARDIGVMDLAEELGVTSAYISAVESGTRTPSLRLLKEYARVFNVDANIILNFSDASKPNDRFEDMLLLLLKKICE